MSHFDEMTCMQYLDGQLERARAAELTAHVDTCEECRRLLVALEREEGLLRAALVEEDEPVPARLLSPSARETTPWAWITAFGLACLGLYALWSGLIEPWMNELTQAGFGQGNLLAMFFFGGVFWKGWSDMVNLVQMLAMLTLGIVGLTLLIRSGKRWTTMAMVMGGLAAVLVLPPGAAAAQIVKGGESYTLSAGQTVDNDLIVMAGVARVDGTVHGDVISFGRSLTINGHVTGDVLCFAERLTMNGTVDGNVRAMASSFNLKGQIGKNVMAFISMLEVDAKSQVGGSLTAFVGQGNVDGRVGRDVLAFSEHFDLNGFIGGSVLARGERLSIGPGAEIKGKVKFRGRKQPQVAEGAKLAAGAPEFEEVKRRRGPNYASPRFYMWQAVWWGAAFVFGLVTALLAPGFFREAVRSGGRYGASLGAGLVTFILTPVVACIACLTLVGIPVGIAGVLLWAIALYGAQVFLGAWLGNKMLGESSATGALLGRMALGLLVIRIVVNIPYVGGWARFVVILLGLGAMTLAIYKRTQPEAAAA